MDHPEHGTNSETPRPTFMRTAGADADVLLRVSTAVHSVQALYAARDASARELLERQLLELIMESVPAQRGAIVLVNDSAETTAMPEWSRKILDQVIGGGMTILENGIGNGGIFSRVAVPLSVSGKVLGAIYLDSSEPESRFSEDDLELLTAISGIAAMALENARYVEWLRGENQRLREEIEVRHNMVGESPAIKQVCQFIARVAASDSTVLICGESGTGKELVARAIHQTGPRARQPFIAINCAALTETLLESEFFGYEKGAFTGALAQKRGKLEVAEGGTVFLDEIGEMAPGLQAKLLRVLQERAFERVGGTRSIPVDVRVVAATNRDLPVAIREGKFRLDLYYRLNVVALHMPPLRERREDIPILARYFATQLCKSLKRPPVGISPEARACLMNYDWPGNIRELQNAIEHAVVLGASDLIRPEDLPESVLECEPASGFAGGRYQAVVQDTKRQAILKAVEQARGNVTGAAKLLGVHPNYLHRLIRNLNLRPELKKFA
ncbi:MAG: sigma 54-interacting transcriptional regulator [Acidobacteriota bacterium]|nr:sigma 54-interacting transcriptional regulator [Acidobacteriota bacterium]